MSMQEEKAKSTETPRCRSDEHRHSTPLSSSDANNANSLIAEMDVP